MLSGDRTAEWNCAGLFSAYTAILVPLGPWKFFHSTEARVHCVCAGTWAVPSDHGHRSDCFTATGFKPVFPTVGKTTRKVLYTWPLPFPDSVCTLLHLLKTQFSSAERHCHGTGAGGWRRLPQDLPSFLFCWKLTDPSPHSL